jgi:hypothetical protein
MFVGPAVGRRFCRLSRRICPVISDRRTLNLKLGHRLRLVGTYFDLTDRFTPNPAGEVRPVVRLDGNGKDPEGSQRGKIVVSVAKRLVPSAVRRNTVKRIVREAWRLAGRPGSESSQQGAQDSSAPASVQDLPAGSAATGPTRVCLVRLKRYPGKDLKAVKKKARKATKARPPAAPGTSAGAAVLGLTAIKRSLRSDVDQLFAAFLSGRAGHRRSSVRNNA